MTERTADEVGALLRERRVALNLKQESVDGVSSSTVRKAEGGHLMMRDLTRSAYMRALQWPADAIERLIAGDDPNSFEAPGTSDRLDFNSRIARMPEHVRRTIEDLIDQFEAQERRS